MHCLSERNYWFFKCLSKSKPYLSKLILNILVLKFKAISIVFDVKINLLANKFEIQIKNRNAKQIIANIRFSFLTGLNI